MPGFVKRMKFKNVPFWTEFEAPDGYIWMKINKNSATKARAPGLGNKRKMRPEITVKVESDVQPL